MSDYGDLEFDPKWQQAPVEKYLEYKEKDDKITDKRLNAIENVVVGSDNTDWDGWIEHVPDWQNKMTVGDARSFMQQVVDSPSIENSTTVEGIMDTIQTFLSELYERDIINSNPASFVCDETDFEDLFDDDADEEEEDKWIDRDIEQIGNFLREIPNIKIRAMGMTLGKTGIRDGENYNIDLPYVHLDDDIYYRTIDRHGISIHSKISDNPDTLYIPSGPTIDEVYRSEERKRGNKRERGTRIPIDGELKRALLDYLTIRPNTEYPHPFWVASRSNDRTGKHTVGRKLCTHFGEETGFVSDGTTSKFTPHYFRHVFTTEMKPGRGHYDGSIPPTLVKYIRGDVDDDVMGIYTHDWGNQVREKYINAIYKFGVYG